MVEFKPLLIIDFGNIVVIPRRHCGYSKADQEGDEELYFHCKCFAVISLRNSQTGYNALVPAVKE